MSSIINATTTNGVVIQPDNSGSLVLQTNNGTTAVTVDTSQNTTLAGKLTTASSGIQFSDSSIQTAAASPYVLKNRIINGAMVIDQRNAGASVNVAAGDAIWDVDRWMGSSSQANKFTLQQSTTVPAGFKNSMVATVASTISVGAGDYAGILQRVEGLNTYDFDWGLSTAKTVTLSFWVRSSVTGTYCIAIRNSGDSRSYVSTYTISSANTWEQKSITIAGDTSGTWLTTNGIGLVVYFTLSCGSTYGSATANTWSSSLGIATSSQTQWITNSGATFYITGVQLEIGSTATPFERRLYNQELANCQRYFEKSYNVDVAVNTNDPNNGVYRTQGTTDVGNNMLNTFSFKVMKRVSPTMTAYSQSGGSNNWDYNKSGTSSTTAISWNAVGQQSAQAFFNAGAAFIAVTMAGHWTASAEL